MSKNSLVSLAVCLTATLLLGQDPVTSSSNYKDLPPVPRGIVEPPPLPAIKTSPKDLRRKTRVIKRKKTRAKKKVAVAPKKKATISSRAKVAR